MLAGNNPKSDLHNINAHTKFGENPLMFIQVISSVKEASDVRQTDRHTDGHTVMWRGIKLGHFMSCTYCAKISSSVARKIRKTLAVIF